MKTYIGKTFDLSPGDIGFDIKEDTIFEDCIFNGGRRAILGKSKYQCNLYLNKCRFYKQKLLAVSFYSTPGLSKRFEAYGCIAIGPENPVSHLFYLHPHLFNWKVDNCYFEGAGKIGSQSSES